MDFIINDGIPVRNPEPSPFSRWSGTGWCPARCTRSVTEEAERENMKIHPIQTGTVQIKPSQRVGRGRGWMRQVNILLDRTWTEPLPIYAWAIETDEGVIVVDTGETARTSEPGYF